MDLVTAVFALAPAAGLLSCVVGHVLVSRAAPKLPRPHAIVASTLAGLAVVVSLGVSFAHAQAAPASAADRWGATATWVLAYVCLAYCYVFGFFNLGESARRIRLLIELHAAGDRGLTLEEILTAYNARLIVEARLARLLSGGQIALRGGRYVLRSSFVLSLARVLVVVKLMVLGVPSEFGAGGR